MIPRFPTVLTYSRCPLKTSTLYTRRPFRYVRQSGTRQQALQPLFQGAAVDHQNIKPATIRRRMERRILRAKTASIGEKSKANPALPS